MSFDYSDLVTTATELLTEFGQTATLVRTVAAGSSETETGVALQLRINEGDRRNLAGPAGIAPLDARKYLVGAGITPKRGDRLTVGANSVIVERMDVLAPGATTLIWTVLGVAG